MTASFFQMNTAFTSGSRPLPSNTIANLKGELKAITTRTGIILDGPFVPIPPPFINPKEDERVEETLTDQDLAEYTIRVPPPLLHINITLVDALILIPKYQKMLKSLLSNKEKLLELENTPRNENCSAVILKKLPEKLGDPGKFLIPCESPFLGKTFLTDHFSLIDVHEEEMILRDGDERLTLNMRHDTSSYSNQPQKESINMINIFNDSCKDFLEDLFETNHLSGNPTFSSHSDLTSPEVKDDIFDPKGDNVLIEKLINLDSVDEDNLANLNDNLVDTMPEMFTDKHALDYSSPPLYDENNDDLFEDDSDTEYAYDDPFDSKGEKIKESKLLIDELDLPRSSDFLPSPEYDSCFFKDFSMVDAFPLTKNEKNVFNPGILIQENLFEVITRVALDKNVKKIAISHASLILEDFDPPLYELPFHKEVPWPETLLSFSSENEEKVFKPGILTSKGVHSSLLSKLSYRVHRVFKIIKILENPMEIFPCSFGEDIRILDVPCLHIYPS
nr:hypothetical protein [Tanacetum cinerariifolium]